MLKLVIDVLSTVRNPIRKFSKCILYKSRTYSQTLGKSLYSGGIRSYYDVLQIDKSATHAEIKTAYFKLSLQYHPDKMKDGNDTIFKDIAEAYKVLGNVTSRRRYDLGYFFQSEHVQGKEVEENSSASVSDKSGIHEFDKVVKTMTTSSIKLTKDILEKKLDRLESTEDLVDKIRVIKMFSFCMILVIIVITIISSLI